MKKSILFAGLLLSSCAYSGEIDVWDLPWDDDSGGSDPVAYPVRIMTFNVRTGGTSIDFSKVPQAIRAAGADIVGLQEGLSSTNLIAQQLGWSYVYEDPLGPSIVSRYPIVGSAPSHVEIEIAPEVVIALANVHLPGTEYGPYMTATATEAQILDVERRVRLPGVTTKLEQLAPLLDQGRPVFFVGDFNAPSHLDWGAEDVGKRPHMTFMVRWPVSLAMEEAGFIDSYRAVSPNPGLTWRALIGGLPNEPHDRIDFVYYSGPVELTYSVVVGEESIRPWPSDHRAVVAEFEVKRIDF